ncbi:MAG: aldo/keto reductase, partial [Cytophagales bacterium]|nr:aldo/keto reductase [Cytophagales bacterium]
RPHLSWATKVAGPADWLGYLRADPSTTEQQIRQALNDSLRRLQTDFVDLYQLHWPARKTNFFGKLGYVHEVNDPWQDNFLEIVQTMQELAQEGKIRHFGISNETAWGTMRLVHLAETHGLPRPVSIQNPYSLLNRTFEAAGAEVALRERVGLLAYSPLGFGVLTGKYLNEQKPENARLTLFPRMARYSKPNATKATERYVKLAQDHGLSPAQMALAYVNSRKFITANIIGATNMAQLQENISSADLALSPELISEIEAIHAELPNPAP